METCEKDGVDKQEKEADAKSTDSRIHAFKKISTGLKAFKLLESQGFIVGKTLGSGSYAKVKSAYDLNRKQKVAIKIIDKKRASEDFLTKFLPREIEVMRTLGQHYAIIKFFQIIETTSRYFFVMELAVSGDLLDEIKSKGHIKEDQAGIWFINLYDGIRYMHSKSIVHRDLKCENLVISAENSLKITDFGFAKTTSKSKNGSTLPSETYCGSYAYAAPEVLKGIPYNPELSDVWSMGVVLYTMVYGMLPFDDSDHKRLIKQATSRITFPTTPEVSPKCKMLIVKIFSKATDRLPIKHFWSDPWYKIQREAFRQECADKDIADESKMDDSGVGEETSAEGEPLLFSTCEEPLTES